MRPWFEKWNSFIKVLPFCERRIPDDKWLHYRKELMGKQITCEQEDCVNSALMYGYMFAYALKYIKIKYLKCFSKCNDVRKFLLLKIEVNWKSEM